MTLSDIRARLAENDRLWQEGMDCLASCDTWQEAEVCEQLAYLNGAKRQLMLEKARRIVVGG